MRFSTNFRSILAGARVGVVAIIATQTGCVGMFVAPGPTNSDDTAVVEVGDTADNDTGSDTSDTVTDSDTDTAVPTDTSDSAGGTVDTSDADTGLEDSGFDTAEVVDTAGDTGFADTADSGEVHVDNDGDGCTTAIDCDDADASVSPLALEVCGDGIDNDCADGDEVCAEEDSATDTADTGSDTGDAGDTAEPVYVDDDGDGYTTAVDCDDADATIYPIADEVCGDGVDQDCDGEDEACPADSDTGVEAIDTGVAFEGSGDTGSDTADTGSDTATDTGSDDTGSGADSADSTNPDSGADSGTEVTDTAGLDDSADTAIPADSGDTAEEDTGDTAVTEEEVVEPTLDSDGDGLVTITWNLDEGFYGGVLWIWSWSTADWTEIGTADVGTFTGDIVSDLVEVSSGDFPILQGWYLDATGTQVWIAGNIGDSDGDGVYEFAVDGEFTFDGVSPVFTIAHSYDGDGDGSSTGQFDGAYAYCYVL